MTIKIDNDLYDQSDENNQNIQFSRKVSLNSLGNILNLPKDFFSILEDIKLGCYPRLNSHYISNHNLSVDFIKNIPSGNNSISKVFQQLNNNLNYRRPSNLNLSTSSNNSNSNLNNLCNIIKEESNDDVFNKTNSNNDEQSGFTPEVRRVKHENCSILKCTKSTNVYQLALKLKFDDDQCRSVETNLSSSELFINDITVDMKLISNLTNELIDFGLINLKDKDLLHNSIVKALSSVQMSL